MGSYTEIIDLCIAAAGVYLLYAAITGRTSLFDTERVKKESAERFLKDMKRFCWVGGVLAAGNAALDYFHIEPFAAVTFVLLAVFVVAFAVFYTRFTSAKK